MTEKKDFEVEELEQEQAQVEELESLESEAEIKMDYTLESPIERRDLVQKIIDNTPPEKLTPKYLERLSDYIIFAMDKEEKKSKKILTDNHMVTVNRRQMSFEGLVSKFENGEDGIYGLIANDKNIIFMPKIEITKEDIETVPGLKELRQAIEEVEKREKAATGRKRFLLRKQLIEMRKDQYVLKNAYKKPIYMMNVTKSMHTLNLDDKITVNEDGSLKIEGTFSYLNPDHISAILCNYSRLKEGSWGKMNSDLYYAIMDVENLVDRTLQEDYPLYYKLLIYKIDGKNNEEIQRLLEQEFGIKHSVEYISSLWRNKIPKLLADRAQKDWLEWHYTTEEYGKWKKCSRCGQIKLAHNMFFSKNNTSKDGFYSICKDCRNAKTKQKKILIKAKS